MEAFLNGPQGRTPLGSTPISLGTAPQNHVVFQDEQIAHYHAQISPASDGTGYIIIDQHSQFGTFVNQQQLTPSASHPLRSGDVIRLGNTTTLTFETNSESAGASAIPPTSYGYSGNQGLPGQPPMVGAPPYQQHTPYPTPRSNQKMALGIIGGIVALLVVVIFAIVMTGQSTPEKTLGTYCSALVNGNADEFYSVLSSKSQAKTSVKEIRQGFLVLNAFSGGISDCKYENINVNGNFATADVIMFSKEGDSERDKVELINENGAWKMSEDMSS